MTIPIVNNKYTATLGDVQHGMLRNLIGNYTTGLCGFSIDANANDVQTTIALDYFINGVGYTYAIDAALDISVEVTNLATILAAYPTLPTGYTQVFVFEIDAAGAFTVSAGKQVLTADITAGTKTADWPRPTSTSVCAYGAVKVAATSTFTFGTSTLATVGTFYNLGVVPKSF